MARDENGNVAHITSDTNKVDVVIRGVGQNDIRGLSAGQGHSSSAATGMASFRIYSPLDAMEGDQALIIIGSSDMEITHSITFGDDPNPGVVDPPTDPMVPAGEELGKATNIREGGLNDNGIVQIDWTAAPNAETYAIYAVNVAEASDDDGEVVSRAVNNADATTYNIDGLTVGQEYDIYVVATASGQDASVAGCGSSDSKLITGPVQAN